MRKLLLLALLLGTLTGATWGQGVRYDNVALGPKGPVPFAQIAICTQPASTVNAPCNPVANTYTDTTLAHLCTGSNGCSNPITSDSLGNYHFYAAPGTYTVQVYGTTVAVPSVQVDVLLPCNLTDPGTLCLTGLSPTFAVIHVTGDSALDGDVNVGGNVNLLSNTSAINGPALHALNVNAGAPAVTGDGPFVNVTAANAGATGNHNGGGIQLIPGTHSGSGADGSVIVFLGVAIDGTGYKHKSISTGSISATTRAEVLLSWGTAFRDTAYDVSCTVIDSTTAAATQGLTLERVRTFSTSQVGVVINNPTGGALTGTLSCTATHN